MKMLCVFKLKLFIQQFAKHFILSSQYIYVFINRWQRS